jgi:large subunit ribosomal protein L23
MTSLYDVLRRPIITEKSSYQSAVLNQYAFEVDLGASKSQVKEAVETLFDVRVQKVNIMVMPAKRTRRGTSRRQTTRRPMYKKALVTLAPGDRIDIFEGVQ